MVLQCHYYLDNQILKRQTKWVFAASKIIVFGIEPKSSRMFSHFIKDKAIALIVIYLCIILFSLFTKILLKCVYIIMLTVLNCWFQK
jgi:hypothetical protein